MPLRLRRQRPSLPLHRYRRHQPVRPPRTLFARLLFHLRHHKRTTSTLAVDSQLPAPTAPTRMWTWCHRVAVVPSVLLVRVQAMSALLLRLRSMACTRREARLRFRPVPMRLHSKHMDHAYMDSTNVLGGYRCSVVSGAMLHLLAM